MSDGVLIPPPIEPGEPVPQTPERRLYGGWIILAILIALMVFVSLADILGPKLGPKQYLEQQLLLTSLVRDRATSGGGSKASMAPLEAAVSKVRAEVSTQPLAPQFVAVSDRELKQPIPDFVIQALRRSQLQSSQAMGEIYSKAKITPTQADIWSAQIEGDSFMDRLARVHAREIAGVSDSGRSELAPLWKVIGTKLMILLLGAICLVGLAMWGYYFSARESAPLIDLVPRGLPAGAITKTDADRLAWWCAILMSTFLLASGFVPLLEKVGLGIIAPIAPLIVVIGVATQMPKVPIAGVRMPLNLRPQGVRTRWLVGWAFIGLALELPCTFALSGVGKLLFFFLPTPEHPATNALQNNPSFGTLLVLGLLASVAAPFWEEIAFRYCLLQGLNRFVGFVPAALISSLCFAMIHPQGPVLYLSLGSIAFVSCCLARQTQSLVPSILMHAMHNTLILLLGVLAS